MSEDYKQRDIESDDQQLSDYQPESMAEETTDKVDLSGKDQPLVEPVASETPTTAYEDEDSSPSGNGTSTQASAEPPPTPPERIIAVLAEQLESSPANEALLSQLQQAIATLTQERETLTEKLNHLGQELDAEKQKVETVQKNHIRLAAEFDNFRKRTEKEKKELEKQSKRKTLTEILYVIDNFERARVQIKPSNDGEMEIHKSYQGVYKTLVDSLKRLGVTAMRPEGQPFDPMYHEAMLREATNEHPEGTVLEQLVRGYMIDDQVLRHAMVKVATPKEADSEEGSDNQDKS